MCRPDGRDIRIFFSLQEIGIFSGINEDGYFYGPILVLKQIKAIDTSTLPASKHSAPYSMQLP